MWRLIVPLFVLAVPAMAAMPGSLVVSQPWSRPATAGATGAGFMTLKNAGPSADALTGVSSSLARKGEIHRSSLEGGVMSMRRQTRVEIPPGGQVAFAPGGYHLMFYDLARPLKPGDRLPATLTFQSGRKLAVAFAVGAGAAPAPAPEHKH